MRRFAVTLLYWLCGAGLAGAQELPARAPVIGWLSPATTQSYEQSGPGTPGLRLLRDSLARHGLIDGKNIRIDMRLAGPVANFVGRPRDGRVGMVFRLGCLREVRPRPGPFTAFSKLCDRPVWRAGWYGCDPLNSLQ